MILPLERVVNISKTADLECQIDADNDIAAVRSWLSRYSKQTTLRAYKKEAERFLLWCTYERGLYLRQLKVSDFETYFSFLREKPLSKSSLVMAVHVIGSLISYLVNANYLKANPMKLLKTSQLFSQESQERQYRVWARMLEQDEWLAVQNALTCLPEGNVQQIDYKLKTQFLFSLLYLLGLRIHEVANHSWNAFRQLNGQWWFMAMGKGDKLGHIPVNDQLLSMIKIYRLHLGKTPLPLTNETEYLIISKRTKKPLGIRQLFSLVKAVGKIAAEQFKDNPDKYQKLLSLSPHWLRHLSASHQDKAGINGTMIQANHRHGSFSTTQIYLHSEDDRRFNEMQKLRMEVEPKMVVPQESSVKAELKITLTGKAVSEDYELERFISVLEQHILRDLAWNRTEDITKLMERYRKIKIFKKPLEIVYEIEGKFSEERMDYIKRGVIREAEIRLFECGVDYQEL